MQVRIHSLLYTNVAECFRPGHIDGLMQEKGNSIANALELRLSCINPTI